MGFPESSVGKESARSKGDLGSIPGLGRSLEKGKATHSSILVWRNPWTAYSLGLQTVRHDWATFTFTKMPQKLLLTVQIEQKVKSTWRSIPTRINADKANLPDMMKPTHPNSWRLLFRVWCSILCCRMSQGALAHVRPNAVISSLSFYLLFIRVESSPDSDLSLSSEFSSDFLFLIYMFAFSSYVI